MSRFRRFREWTRRHDLGIAITALLLLMLLIYLLPSMVVFIHSGEEGVLWHRFGAGTVTDRSYGEGTQLILPWDVMAVYSVRHQVVTNEYDSLSLDGLTIKVEATTRFRPVRETLGLLHKMIGPDYVDVVVTPEVGAAIRAVIARYRPEDLYTIDRLALQKELLDYLKQQEAELYVEVHDILIRNIVLPTQVQASIESKLTREQQALEYDYKLVAEKKEAERKRIEAQGIADFQDIVSEGISQQYLEWKGIDATLELAKSSNAKIVIIGAGEEGLPLILSDSSFDAPGGGQ